MIDAVLDLSHWQATPDWQALAAGGVAAVILKATQGSSWVDPTFVRRAIDAERAGLLVGAYHFCDDSSPITQAHHFTSVAGSFPVLALDIEQNGIPGNTVTIEQAAEIVSRVQMTTGRLPVVYINRGGPDGLGTGLPNVVLSACPLWFAEYTSRADPFLLPRGWDAWTLWQYTDEGAAAGIDGAVDRNRFNGDLSALNLFWGESRR